MKLPDRIPFFILLFIIIGLSLISVFHPITFHPNIIFGIVIVFFGLIYLYRMFLFGSDPKWIVRYEQYPEALSSLPLLKKMLESSKGKMFFKYFLIPLGFTVGIGVIGFGIFFIFK